MLVDKNVLLIGGASLTSLVVGTATGYLVAKKRLEGKYELLARTEIAEAKEYYDVLHKRNGYASPQAVAERLGLKFDNTTDHLQLFDEAAEALASYQGEEEVEAMEEIPYEADDEPPPYEPFEARTQENSVFEQFPDEAYTEQYRQVMACRGDKSRPYLLTEHEFMSVEDRNTTYTLTYYAGDEVLADERDEMIDDVEGMVGEWNLKQFGWESDDVDPRIIYILNERSSMGFEILLHDTKYSEEVMGIFPENQTGGQRVIQVPAAIPARQRFAVPPGGIVRIGNGD